MPTELLSYATPLTSSDELTYTIQTSTPFVISTPGYDFPTMSPPVVNSTTAGVFFSGPVANSSLVRPTPFFPNTTSAHSHYAVPTLNIANRAPEEVVKNAAGSVVASLAVVVAGAMAAVLII